MSIKLYDYQKVAVELLKSGSILCGGVGSGKSRVAIAYYFKDCKGRLEVNGIGAYEKMKEPKNLYIITTAKKRDTLEWERECASFRISKHSECEIELIIDSWNNISKYVGVKNSFFIFDEQRLVGSGTWVKSFLKIAKHNKWILLSATPGDTWTDYIPVFVANKFYKNRTEFLREHAVYNRFTKYPKIEKFINSNKLSILKNQITVTMHYEKPTISHNEYVPTKYNKEMFNKVMIKRWNIFKNKPIKNVGELCYLMRKVVNSDPSRIEAVNRIIDKHKKVIIFYNFDYELDILRTLKIKFTEWNGHNHQEVPKGNSWAYLVQYTAGAEGWNCIDTDTIIFFSLNYSYKTMVQAAGRIDRLNTPFKDLYYYSLRSSSPIDLAINQALKRKKAFNTNKFK